MRVCCEWQKSSTPQMSPRTLTTIRSHAASKPLQPATACAIQMIRKIFNISLKFMTRCMHGVDLMLQLSTSHDPSFDKRHSSSLFHAHHSPVLLWFSVCHPGAVSG